MSAVAKSVWFNNDVKSYESILPYFDVGWISLKSLDTFQPVHFEDYLDSRTIDHISLSQFLQVRLARTFGLKLLLTINLIEHFAELL